MDFGKRLKELMSRANVNRYKLSKASGVSYSFIRELEEGIRRRQGIMSSSRFSGRETRSLSASSTISSPYAKPLLDPQNVSPVEGLFFRDETRSTYGGFRGA